MTRDEAAALFDGAVDHIYQGDIFESLELMVPRPGGTFDPVLCDVIVISHDCEYTKIAHTVDKPLLVAPLRDLTKFAQRDAIVEGRARALWLLPHEPPVNDEMVVDFRLIQPAAVDDIRNAKLLTCLSAEAKEVLRARLALFLIRLEQASTS